MHLKTSILPLIVFLLAQFSTLFAQDVNATLVGKLAVKGYDPVAYFTAGTPVKGDKKLTHSYQGATWRFSSAANRQKFIADPAAYAPQYGGYCAWAVSQGNKANINPKAWKIVDGKLYLNYSLNIQERWEKDIPGFIQKADANWPAVSKK